jgi:hypothetical protein
LLDVRDRIEVCFFEQKMIMFSPLDLGVSTEDKMPSADFRALCCDHFGCPPEAYEQTVFWQCLHDDAKLMARVLHKFDPDFFRWDYLLIRSLSTVTTPAEMEVELNNYRYQYRAMGFLRRNLRLRVSGQKIINLSKKLFGHEKRNSSRVAVCS